MPTIVVGFCHIFFNLAIQDLKYLTEAKVVIFWRGTVVGKNHTSRQSNIENIRAVNKSEPVLSKAKAIKP